MATALDMAEELGIEWGAAPWSPSGWPLRVGDRISHEAFVRLDKSFSAPWVEGVAVNWVDDLPFVGRFYLTAGAPGTHTYYGHFPLKASRLYKALLPDLEAEFLPSHLWGRDVDHLFRRPGDVWAGKDCSYIRGPCETLAELRERWHGPWYRRHGDGGLPPVLSAEALEALRDKGPWVNAHGDTIVAYEVQGFVGCCEEPPKKPDGGQLR